MAGSYKHCCKEDGTFIGEDFTEMIENLSDAYEACEMMHWMIDYLSCGNPEKISEAQKAYFGKLESKTSDKLNTCPYCKKGKLIDAVRLTIIDGNTYVSNVEKCNECCESIMHLEEAMKLMKRMRPSFSERVRRLLRPGTNVESIEIPRRSKSIA